MIHDGYFLEFHILLVYLKILWSQYYFIIKENYSTDNTDILYFWIINLPCQGSFVQCNHLALDTTFVDLWK